MISSKLLDVKGSKSWSLSIAIWNAITYSFPLRRFAASSFVVGGRASWPCHLHNHPSTSVHLSGQFSTKLQANVLQAPFKFIHIQYSITVTWNWRLSSWERVHRNWLFRMLQQQIPHIILIQVAVGTLELAPQVNDKYISNKTIQNHTKPSCPERSNWAKNPSKTWSTRSIISLTSCKERITFRFRGRKAFKQSSSCTCTRPVLSSQTKSTATTKRRETF